MRKIFIITVLSFFSLMTYSQEKNNTSSSETKSKAIEYLEKNGMFVSKEFYNIGKVKGID